MPGQSNWGQIVARLCFAAGTAILLPAICLSQTRKASSATHEQDLSALAQKARTALLEERFEEAVLLYQRLVLALPAEPGARLNLAMALHSAGRYAESVAQLERVRVSQAQNPRFWFLLGVGYLKLEQPGKAVDPLGRAVQLDPSYTPGRIEYAGALLESGSLEKAESAFRTLSADEPGLAKAWQGLAISRLELSRETSVELERLAPRSSFQYALAAQAESALGDKEAVNALYRKALAAAPAAPWLQAESAAAEAGANRVEPDEDRDAGHPMARAFFRGQAERVLELSEHARGPEALYWRSRAYNELARIAVERLSSLPPSSEQHELLAVALERAGRLNESSAEWREAVRMSPGDRRLRGELARSLRLNRQYGEAVPMLEDLLRIEPARAEWQFELGDSLLNTGRPEQALVHLSRAVELRPDMLTAQALFGQVLLQSGDAQSAVVHLEKAAPLDRDGSIHFQLAGAYRSLGRVEAARQALARQKELQAAAAARGEKDTPAVR